MTDAPSHPVVVDASVAVKWVVAEPLSDMAELLYDTCLASGLPLIAPSLLPNEVTNAIYRQMRRGLLRELWADAAVTQFFGLNVQLLDPPGLTMEAYAFAKVHQLGAIYDSLYIVLAQRLQATCWTDDQTLLNNIGGIAPWVRWIGDYPGG